ncbi:hypothetical protein Q5O14_04265 [Eubacteriaceae bacterium ES2]|nr:hypothetical protein Q5O14_04265 [Eubacteriaceae bacterium ES2]
MGKQFLARCNQCLTEFEVREGSGLSFYLLHCDTCGKEKVLRQDEVMAVISEQISDLPFKEKIEAIAGSCENGNYRLKARARCPNCGSDDYAMAADGEGKINIVFYD